MTRIAFRLSAFSVITAALLGSPSLVFAQGGKVSPASAPGAGLTAEKAMALAAAGHCQEAMPALKRALSSTGDLEIKKHAGIAGLRCALNSPGTDSALDFLRLLSHQFPNDPEVLFVVVHAYSDLSSRTAQFLGRSAPNSVSAHKLNAEALEMQGKWDEAQREYEAMIEQAPDSPGLHFLLGRLLLSRPEPDAAALQRAKEEFQKELKIDPHNAGAEYILGEMARQQSQLEEAISHFSEAARMDPNFGDAFMGWGFSLVAQKRYQEAVEPLRAAVRLQQGNPSAHYNLAVALSRSGQKEEAEKEFAVHRQLTQKTAPPEEKPQ